MNKQDFLLELRKRLSAISREEQNDRLAFYSEMIDDFVEEGMTEEEAVEKIGTVESVAEQILQQIPMPQLVKDAVIPKRRVAAWEIVLLVLGSPVWMSLLVAAAAVVLALYVSLWSVIIALWAVGASFAVCTLTGCVSAIIFVIQGRGILAAAMLGAGLCLAGLAIFTFFGCKALTRGLILLTKKWVLALKKYLSRKGNGK